VKHLYAAINAMAYLRLEEEAPKLLRGIRADLAEGATPDQVFSCVLNTTQDAILANLCIRAARHILSEQAATTLRDGYPDEINYLVEHPEALECELIRLRTMRDDMMRERDQAAEHLRKTLWARGYTETEFRAGRQWLQEHVHTLQMQSEESLP